MIKIFFVTSNFNIGGAQKVFASVLRNFDRKKFEVYLLAPEYEGTLICKLPKDITFIPLHRIRYAPFELLCAIWKHKPDVIYSTFSYVNFGIIAMRWLFPRIKVIIRESSIPSDKVHKWKYPLLMKLAYRILYRFADKIITQCMAMEDDLAWNYGIPRGKFVRINNPIDYDDINAFHKTDNPYRYPDKINLLYVGTLTKDKGIERLLIEYSLFKNKERYHLTIVGTGNLVCFLGDNITFVGMQYNLAKYYFNADCYIHASYYDAMPNTVLEAISFECNILVMPCKGGVGELLLDFGMLGSLMCENERLEDKLAHISKKVKNVRYIEEYDAANVVKEYEKVFAE